MIKQFTLKLLASVFFLTLAGSTFAQFTGKAGGNLTPFFDTNPQGGQLGHLNAGTFGSFSAADSWIGIGRPSFAGSALPVYGIRIQDEKQAATMSLNDNTGSGTKDFELQWGPDDNSVFRLNFIKDIFSPGSIINIMTALPKGRVGINNDVPDFVLDVRADGTNGDPIAIRGVNVNNGSTGIRGEGVSTGVFGQASGGSSSLVSTGVWGNNSGSSGARRGLYGLGNCTNGVAYGAVTQGTSSTSTAYGVLTSANSTSGISYGVFSSGSTSSGTAYAGWFNGHVQINGSLTVTSDQRLKENITSEENVMDRILQLRPTTYNFRNDGMAAEMNLAQGLQHGFIAQELETVFPELVEDAKQVTSDENGKTKSVDFKSVNYISLIPVLTAGIQEQQSQIEVQDALLQAQQAENQSLRAELAELRNRLDAIENNATGKSGANGLMGQAGSVLYQNTPNPFDRETNIRYSISGNFQSAEMLVFDMNGRQMKAFTNLEAGENAITLQGSDLEAGMYIYTLIVDGEEVATKRMILTK